MVGDILSARSFPRAPASQGKYPLPSRIESPVLSPIRSSSPLESLIKAPTEMSETQKLVEETFKTNGEDLGVYDSDLAQYHDDQNSAKENLPTLSNSHLPNEQPLLTGIEQEPFPGVMPEEDLEVLSPAEQRKPAFLIIGSKKCGTGALREMLPLHSKIKPPLIREAKYFDRDYLVKSEQWYLSQMPFTHEDELGFEKTPSYFPQRLVPKRVMRFDPHMKMVLVVKNPVTR